MNGASTQKARLLSKSANLITYQTHHVMFIATNGPVCTTGLEQEEKQSPGDLMMRLGISSANLILEVMTIGRLISEVDCHICQKKPEDIPFEPAAAYPEWINYADWLDTKNRKRGWRSFEEA